MYHKDGGRGVPLVGGDGRNGAPSWPTVSADGRYLYYQVGMDVDDDEPLSGSMQLRRFAFKTGEIVDITAGESSGAAAGRLSSGGAAAPEVSPDGRWLAFARQIPDGTLVFKGHEYGPRTALWIRDLRSGAERMVMDPIEPMVASGSKTLGVLPRYRWAHDGRSILLMQGGKVRRLDVATGEVATIPFTASVHRTLSQMARNEFRITDGPLDVKFFRWPTSTPDGRLIAFQAVGHIWVQDGPSGTPRRITPASFTQLEYAPTWSPDGRTLAFVTFEDTLRGAVWKVPAGGGAPVRLSRDPGDYVDPVWSPDGRSVVVARGDGATARGRTMTHNAYYDLVRFPAAPPAAGDTGVVVATVTRPSGASLSGESRRQLVRPSFGPEGRLFWIDEVAGADGAARGHGAHVREARRQRQAGEPELPLRRRDRALARRDVGRLPGGGQRLRRPHGLGRDRRRGAARGEAARAVPRHAAHARRRALPPLAGRDHRRVRERARTSTCTTWTRARPTRPRSRSAFRATSPRGASRSPTPAW